MVRSKRGVMRLDRAPTLGVTVVALAPGAGEGFTVFMSRRRAGEEKKNTVLAFPAGTVKRDDCIARTGACCRGMDGLRARRILGSDLTPQRALGFWVAVTRVLYEDYGLLLCTTKDGDPVDLGPGPLAQRLREKQRLLVNGELDFVTLLQTEGLVCDLERITHFSHWISGGLIPPNPSNRTFLVYLPSPRRSLSLGDMEFESSWFTPETALDLLDRGEVQMDFPTYGTLRTLADFDSLATLWDEFGPSEKMDIK